MPAQFPMFRIERDCNYAQQCRLMRAWVEWDVPKAQARAWWQSLGFDAQKFNRVRWEAEHWIRREVLYMQLVHAQSIVRRTWRSPGEPGT